MKQWFHRILKIISSAIFVILILLMVVIIFYIVRVNFLAGHDKLGEVRINIYTILTQSMYPTIKAGDVIITYKEDNNKYSQGDVITFISEKNGGIAITHRVKEVYEVNDSFSYKTKGDNNNTADNEIIKSENVLGKVVAKIPKVGYIQQFLVSKFGWIVAVILPALGVIIYDALKVILILIGVKEKPVRKYTLKGDEDRIEEARKRLSEVVKNEKEE